MSRSFTGDFARLAGALLLAVPGPATSAAPTSQMVRLCTANGEVLMIPFPIPGEGNPTSHACHAPFLCERQKVKLRGSD